MELTKREIEVLQLMAHGLVVRQIATTLDIKYNTAASYVRNIYDKFGVKNRVEAVSIGYARGVIENPQIVVEQIIKEMQNAN